MGGSRFASFGKHFGVGVLICKPVDKLIRHEVGISGGVDTYLGKHLVSNNLNVFVVDIHAL